MRIPGSEYGAIVVAAQEHDIPEEYLRTTLIPQVGSMSTGQHTVYERMRPTAQKVAGDA